MQCTPEKVSTVFFMIKNIQAWHFCGIPWHHKPTVHCALQWGFILTKNAFRLFLFFVIQAFPTVTFCPNVHRSFLFSVDNAILFITKILFNFSFQYVKQFICQVKKNRFKFSFRISHNHFLFKSLFGSVGLENPPIYPGR